MNVRNFTLGLMAISLLALGGCSNSGENGQDARIRLLNASPDYDSLDLYVNNGDDDTDNLELEAVGSGTASDYVTLDPDTYAVKLKRNGVSGTLQTLNDQQLAEESHATYVAYGSSGHFATLTINEDVSEPDGGEAIVQVVNASEAGSLDVYLTDDADSLEDVSATFSAIGSGSDTIDSGEYRLRVTGAGDKDDLRLDVSGITFDSEQVVSIILTATPGGGLVNALVLPQQGELSTHANIMARVRGAVGVGNGSAVSVSVGGVSLLTNATAGVIGSGYEQVEAGTAAVTVRVNGNAVAVADQTLTAGADYTLLVWENGEGVQTTLANDDNRLLTSGKAKLRLMNGMSELAAPITLEVDYFPVAEAISLGHASDYTEFDSGSDYQLDVRNAETAERLLSRSSVSLQGDAVYTLFMSGGGTTAAGTLRKDR